MDHAAAPGYREAAQCRVVFFRIEFLSALYSGR